MKVAVFSAQPYDRHSLDQTNSKLFASHGFNLTYHPIALSIETVALAQGHEAICVFVNDVLSEAVLRALHAGGTRAILLRCAGFNNIDLATADTLGLFVAHVPAYSPEAVAEFTLALILTLNRRTHRAYNRVREGNFSLDGLLGFTMHGKTVGIIGTGRIGMAVARILHGFGCRLLAFDPVVVEEFRGLGAYVELDALLQQADFVTLHCPLLPQTSHIINAATLARMKEGAMLVNSSRGGLIDTPAVIEALKARRLGALAIDVYEQESNLFYHDHSADIIDDDVFQRLMTFPNVLVSGHQGFFTAEALSQISETSLANLAAFAAGAECRNRLTAKNTT